MANYARPGVYVEEYLNPVSDVVVAPGASAAAFVGVSSGGGPVGPIQITSWSQYQALFGGVSNANDDLAYAVYTFFANGGSGCYIVRALNTDATAASLAVNDTQGTPAPTITFTAQAAGVWSSAATSNSRVFITIQPSTPVGRFDVIVEVGSGSLIAAREQFLELTMDPNDGRNAIEIINSPVIGSKYIKVTPTFTGSYAAAKNPAAVTKSPLTGGTDGTGTPDVYAATQLLGVLDENLVINVPAAAAADITSIANWAVAGGRHFVVADVPKPAASETAAASVTAQTAFVTAVPKVSQLAVYGPWQFIQDPGSRAGAMRLTAPGGAVVGQFLRTDAFRGIHKAPAGTQTSLSGVLAPYVNFLPAQEDSLFAANVNLLKRVPGNNVCIMGARTQSTGFPDRYVPVRRTLISIKSTLQALVRPSLFENNDEELWGTIEDVVSTYLTTLLEIGALKGATPAEAYYVRCDSTNNDLASIGAGIVNVEVGVALQNPAEFIVIRLGQTSSGTSTVSDSLEE